MRHIVRGTTTSHVSPIGPNSQVRRQFKFAVGTSQRFNRTLKSVTRPGTVCALVVQEQCPLCLGHTQVPCQTCQGQGRLTKAGYHANNPVFVARIVGATKLMYLPDQNILCVSVEPVTPDAVDTGSKWTALQRTLGWRHFTVTHKMKEGRHTYALLVATCDNTATLWVCKNTTEPKMHYLCLVKFCYQVVTLLRLQ